MIQIPHTSLLRLVWSGTTEQKLKARADDIVNSYTKKTEAGSSYLSANTVDVECIRCCPRPSWLTPEGAETY